MAENITGGCDCGAIRYESRAAPFLMVECQCLHCQKDSGTGHASHVLFARSEVTVTGAASSWDMLGDSGTTKTRAFCPACGTAVYGTFAAQPDVLAVRASTLDDPSLYKPDFATYHARAQVWDHLDPALKTYDIMPPG
ncbi:MAG: GFA family protein [bacterium]